MVNFKDKRAANRDRFRQERETWKTNERRYNKAMQLQKLGVPVRMVDGYPEPALTEEDLDTMLATEHERRATVYEAFERAGSVTRFPALGVQILTGEDQVYSIGNHDPWEKTNDSRQLGPLAGAEARVTDATSSFSWGKALIMPVATAPLARKETADAMVVFSDGTVHTTALDGSRAVREARKECISFNVLAGSHAQTPTMPRSDPAEKLQKLQDLREAGLITQEEYETKRADVINSI
jgi:hypothetical protein